MEKPRPAPHRPIAIMRICLHIYQFVMFIALLPCLALADDFEYGRRPPDSVFDPRGFLGPDLTREIADPLSRIREEQGVDVIVVVIDSLEGAPPAHVAGRFAAAWCEAPIHAVVLHVPGAADGPWIVPAGKLIEHLKPEVLHQDVADAERRARLEPTEAGRVRAAATETADRLRYWLGTAVNRSEFITDARIRIRLEQETKARQWRIAMLTAAAAAIPVLALISALFYFLRRKGPRHFPNPNPPRRLGAPYCGGNHASVHLGPPGS
jgi:hypothetical protein